MAKKQFSTRLRPDQEKRIQDMIDMDPELDASKIIRKAIDAFFAGRANEESDQGYRAKKKTKQSSG